MSSVLSLEIARALFPSITKDALLRSSPTESTPSHTKANAKSQIKIKVVEDVQFPGYGKISAIVATPLYDSDADSSTQSTLLR